MDNHYIAADGLQIEREHGGYDGITYEFIVSEPCGNVHFPRDLEEMLAWTEDAEREEIRQYFTE